MRVAGSLFIVAGLATLVAATPAFAAPVVRGSAEQVQVTGATPHSTLVLERGSTRAGTTKVGALGGAVFRNVTPGGGYRVVQGADRSPALRVLTDRPKPPSTKVYDQKLPDGGYGYLTTRDGTKLAIDVREPARPGPLPDRDRVRGLRLRQSRTARESGIAGTVQPSWATRSSTSTCAAPAARAAPSTTSSATRASTATTPSRRWPASPGCSTTGRAWPGISYGGISQLFVGSTRPPHLAAMTPLSVIDNTATTLYPGGMLNIGLRPVLGQGPRP